MSDNVRPRRVILDLAVTLDGFIEGENGEVDWCIMDPEMEFNHFLDKLIPFCMEEKVTIYGENILHKTMLMKLKKKCGNWYIVKKNMCFLEHKQELKIE